MPTKQTKKIFSITQNLMETYWFDWVTEIASFGNLKREHATIIREKNSKRME